MPAFQGFADQATRRLTVLDNAASLQDLGGLPSNRLESLSGVPDGPIQHTDQSPVAHLLSLGRRRALRRGGSGLPPMRSWR